MTDWLNATTGGTKSTLKKNKQTLLRALPQAVMTSSLMRADNIRPYNIYTKHTLKKTRCYGRLSVPTISI
ncbi:MAG: hypothetical protein RR234_04185, partial [Christensenella sp.]